MRFAPLLLISSPEVKSINHYSCCTNSFFLKLTSDSLRKVLCTPELDSGQSLKSVWSNWHDTEFFFFLRDTDSTYARGQKNGSLFRNRTLARTKNATFQLLRTDHKILTWGATTLFFSAHLYLQKAKHHQHEIVLHSFARYGRWDRPQPYLRFLHGIGAWSRIWQECATIPRVVMILFLETAAFKFCSSVMSRKESVHIR